MPPRLFSCTPSRLTAWSDCPRRYRFAYVDRPTPPKGPPWAHNRWAPPCTGARGPWSLPTEDRTRASARLVGHAGSAGFRDDNQEAVWPANARRRWSSGTRGLDPADDRAASSAPSPCVPIGSLTGPRRPARPARRRPGGRRLQDRPARADTDDARGSLALAVYAAAAARTLRRDVSGSSCTTCRRGDVISWEHSESRTGPAPRPGPRHRRRGGRGPAGGVRRRRRAAFPPRPGSMCGWCDFVRTARRVRPRPGASLPGRDCRRRSSPPSTTSSTDRPAAHRPWPVRRRRRGSRAARRRGPSR